MSWATSAAADQCNQVARAINNAPSCKSGATRSSASCAARSTSCGKPRSASSIPDAQVRSTRSSDGAALSQAVMAGQAVAYGRNKPAPHSAPKLRGCVRAVAAVPRGDRSRHPR